MTNTIVRPVVLPDLDDTLFQTKRKMVNELAQEPFRVGALDRSLSPRSYMNEEQAMLVDWLLANAEVIPVTARGTEEFSRVQIPFTSWAITTHGAVILTPDGKCDPEWQEHITTALQPYRQRLLDMQEAITELMAERGIAAWARINYEYDDMPIYLVMKHTDSTKLHELNAIGDEVEEILAAQHLLTKLRAERGTFPTIGLGDSLTDFSFLRLCSWFGMPKQSQFVDAIKTNVFGE